MGMRYIRQIMAPRTIGIMQPYFFPYIGYFQHIYACDVYVFLDDVDFANREYVRRNSLLISGCRRPFGIEIADRHQDTEIRDLKLNPNPRWRHKLLKTVDLNYKKAPFFDTIRERILRPVIESDTKSAAEFNKLSIALPCEYLGIKTKLIWSSGKYEKKSLKGPSRIRAICKSENADIYINTPGGMALYDQDEYAADGLELRFLQPDINAMRYAQGKAEWVPHLSIIDVLMWNDLITVREFLLKYEFIHGE